MESEASSDQVNSITAKFNRSNALLLEIRNYVNMKTLRNSTFQYLILTQGTQVMLGLKILIQ